VRTAVWIVAIETAFADRRMLIEKRPALFAVTLVTLIVDGVRSDQSLSLRAVRIMTVGAEHLLLSQRVVRRLEQSHPNLLVAPGTQLLLGWLRE